MGSERRLVDISLCNGYSPIAAVGVERGKDNIVSKAVNAVIYPRNWVGISHGGFVESWVIDTELKRSIDH